MSPSTPRAVAFTVLFLLTVLSLLAAPFPAGARHGGVLLDARHATPGTHLELVEIPAALPSTSVRYELRANGIPRDLPFGVWTKEFGASFQQVLGRVRVAEDGIVVVAAETASPHQSKRVVIEPGPYPRGAGWEVGLISDDRTVTAFARVIPRPIAARDGACSVSLELASRRGDKFLVSGIGFLPAEEVTIESRIGGRILQKRQRAREDGQLPPDVIAHWPGYADHRAQYAVKGRACEVMLDYEGGDPALARR